MSWTNKSTWSSSSDSELLRNTNMQAYRRNARVTWAVSTFSENKGGELWLQYISHVELLVLKYPSCGQADQLTEQSVHAALLVS